MLAAAVRSGPSRHELAGARSSLRLFFCAREPCSPVRPLEQAAKQQAARSSARATGKKQCPVCIWVRTASLRTARPHPSIHLSRFASPCREPGVGQICDCCRPAATHQSCVRRGRDAEEARLRLLLRPRPGEALRGIYHAPGRPCVSVCTMSSHLPGVIAPVSGDLRASRGHPSVQRMNRWPPAGRGGQRLQSGQQRCRRQTPYAW